MWMCFCQKNLSYALGEYSSRIRSEKAPQVVPGCTRAGKSGEKKFFMSGSHLFRHKYFHIFPPQTKECPSFLSFYGWTKYLPSHRSAHFFPLLPSPGEYFPSPISDHHSPKLFVQWVYFLLVRLNLNFQVNFVQLQWIFIEVNCHILMLPD